MKGTVLAAESYQFKSGKVAYVESPIDGRPHEATFSGKERKTR
jgi:hypothetical protein